MPLQLTIVAKPGKKVPSIAVVDGTIVVAVRERAVDGRANAAVIAALADWLGVRVSGIAILHGATSRVKRFEVAGIDAAVLADKLRSARRVTAT